MPKAWQGIQLCAIDIQPSPREMINWNLEIATKSETKRRNFVYSDNEVAVKVCPHSKSQSCGDKVIILSFIKRLGVAKRTDA